MASTKRLRIHQDSPIGISNPLELFTVKPTSLMVEKIRDDKYLTILGISTTTRQMEFVIKQTPEFLNLRDTILYIKGKVVLASGLDLPDDHNTVHLAANAGHTLWAQPDCYINNQLVSNSNNLYGHHAYLHNLLQYSKEDQD